MGKIFLKVTRGNTYHNYQIQDGPVKDLCAFHPNEKNLK